MASAESLAFSAQTRRLALQGLAEHGIVLDVFQRQRPNAAAIQRAALHQSFDLQTRQGFRHRNRTDPQPLGNFPPHEPLARGQTALQDVLAQRLVNPLRQGVSRLVAGGFRASAITVV